MEERRLQFMLANREVGGACTQYESISVDDFNKAKQNTGQLTTISSNFYTDIYFDGWKDPCVYDFPEASAFWIQSNEYNYGSSNIVQVLKYGSDTEQYVELGFLQNLNMTLKGLQSIDYLAPSWAEGGSAIPFKWWEDQSSYEGSQYCTSNLLPYRVHIDWSTYKADIYNKNEDIVYEAGIISDIGQGMFTSIWQVNESGISNCLDAIRIVNTFR